jgi:hypothetical protein
LFLNDSGDQTGGWVELKLVVKTHV